MKRHSKEYTNELQAQAMEMVELNDGGEVVDFRGTAVRLAEATGCTYVTARKHVARAARRKRHPDYEPPGWGGYRDGSGRKFEFVIDVVNGRAIVSHKVHSQVGLLKYSAAVNWEELEGDAATAVAAQGSGVNVSGLYPCPPELVARAVWDSDEEG